MAVVYSKYVLFVVIIYWLLLLWQLYTFHRLIMEKLEIANFCCPIGDILNVLSLFIDLSEDYHAKRTTGLCFWTTTEAGAKLAL